MNRARWIATPSLSLCLLLPQAPGAAQCPALPPALPATKTPAIPPPQARVCCIFGWAKALDHDQLSGHQYGNGDDLNAATSNTKEPVGYVYTEAAGLVDFGHVRDRADMMFWVYANLLAGSRNFRVGADTVLVSASMPTDPAQIAKLAGAIVYVNSWGHELVTWGDSPSLPLSALGPQEDYSAFSPEDLSSNIVGIQVATRALAAGGYASPAAFNKQMDIAVAALKTELGAQPADTTTKLIAQVQYQAGDTDLAGKWWSRDSTSAIPNFGIRLLRRNFDGSPWKIAGAATKDPPPWLITPHYSDFYGQFLYYMSDKLIVDATQVPATTRFVFTPTLLQWVPLPVGAIQTAATLANAAGGGSCLLGAGRKALTSGQLGTVKLNVDLADGLNVIANMQDMTNAIRTAFVNVNSCLPGKPCTLPAGAKDAGLMDAP
jgi:hypothetical protein